MLLHVCFIGQKRLLNSRVKKIYIKKRLFKALFYPKEVKFYTDNASASVTNSMSVPSWSRPNENAVEF